MRQIDGNGNESANEFPKPESSSSDSIHPSFLRRNVKCTGHLIDPRAKETHRRSLAMSKFGNSRRVIRYFVLVTIEPEFSIAAGPNGAKREGDPIGSHYRGLKNASVDPAESVGGSRARGKGRTTKEETREERGNLRPATSLGLVVSATQGRLDVPTDTMTEEAAHFSSFYSVSVFFFLPATRSRFRALSRDIA